MPTQRNAFRLGTTLIVCFLLFLAIVLWLPQTLTGGPTRSIRVRFSQAQPLPTLEEGSKVLVAGRPVGKVTKLVLEEQSTKPDDPKSAHDLYLVVTAKVDRHVTLRKDCRIRAVGEVLGGAGSLTIDVGADPAEADLSGILEGQPPGGFGAYLEALGKELDGNNPQSLLGQVKRQLNPDEAASLMAKLHKSMDDLNTVTASVSKQLSPAERAGLLAKLLTTMDNINAATGSLRDQFADGRSDVVLAKVHSALDSLNVGLRTVTAMLEENRSPINETMQHVASTATKLDTRIAESLAQELDTRNSAGLMFKLNTAAERFNTSLKDISEITQTTRDVVVLNRENLNKMIANFKETSDHLKGAAKYILAHPWRLMKEPGVTETKQQAIFDAARNFAEAATRLEDATAQLKALSDLHNGNVPSDNADLVRIRTDLQTTFQKFGEAEAALWKQLEVR